MKKEKQNAKNIFAICLNIYFNIHIDILIKLIYTLFGDRYE